MGQKISFGAEGTSDGMAKHDRTCVFVTGKISILKAKILKLALTVWPTRLGLHCNRPTGHEVFLETGTNLYSGPNPVIPVCPVMFYGKVLCREFVTCVFLHVYAYDSQLIWEGDVLLRHW